MVMGGIAQAAGGVTSSLIDAYAMRGYQDEQYKHEMDQFNQLQNMFPFTNLISGQATNFYGNQWPKIEDYLEHPTPPSNLERQLFEFFGGQAPVKGYYRGAVPGAKKGGPGALTNRLLGRYGAGESGPLAGRGPELLGEASDLLRGLIPYGEEWGETGFKTDIQPIQDYAEQMYDYFQAEDAERFGGNIQGSGFMDRSNRTSADLASELGAMEVMLNEAAAGRRMQGLSGPIQNLFTGPMNLETAFATAAAQAGQNYIDRVDQARPGAALLGAMPMFANIDANQGFIQQGFPTSGTDYGNVMAGWGSTAQGIGSGLGNILEAWLGRDQGQNSMGFIPQGTQTGMGWNMPSNATQIGGDQLPWLSGGGDNPSSIMELGSLFQ